MTDGIMRDDGKETDPADEPMYELLGDEGNPFTPPPAESGAAEPTSPQSETEQND
jgi:hypothetical protein